MDLKRTRFAVLVENVNSIAHKWFKDNCPKRPLPATWNFIGEYYLYDGDSCFNVVENKPTDIPVYTEKQFANLLNKSNNKLLNYNQY